MTNERAACAVQRPGKGRAPRLAEWSRTQGFAMPFNTMQCATFELFVYETFGFTVLSELSEGNPQTAVYPLTQFQW